MVHLFRGELGRSDRWRMRLDTTTNWSLTVAAATVSFGWANPNTSSATLVVGIWMVFSFLLIEARRYRYYDLWNHRLRLIEGGYWAPMLRREPADPDALHELAQAYAQPRIRLSWFSAIATRMNRAYSAILIVLVGSYFVKLYTHPTEARSVEELFDRAHLGPFPGGFVFFLMVAFSAGLLFMLAAALVARPPLGELRPARFTHRRRVVELFLSPYASSLSTRRERSRKEARGRG